MNPEGLDLRCSEAPPSAPKNGRAAIDPNLLPELLHRVLRTRVCCIWVLGFGYGFRCLILDNLRLRSYTSRPRHKMCWSRSHEIHTVPTNGDYSDLPLLASVLGVATLKTVITSFLSFRFRVQALGLPDCSSLTMIALIPYCETSHSCP